MKIKKLKDRVTATGKHIGTHVLGHAVIHSSEKIGADIDILHYEDNPVDQIPEKEGVEAASFANSVDEEMSFNEAFSAAREEVGPGGVFVWNNNAYSTYNKEEWEALTPEQLAEYRDSLNAAEAEHEELQNLDNDYGNDDVSETEVEDATVPQDQVTTDEGDGNVNTEVEEQPEITVELEEDLSEEDLAQIEADIEADSQLEIDQDDGVEAETTSDMEQDSIPPIEEVEQNQSDEIDQSEANSSDEPTQEDMPVSETDSEIQSESDEEVTYNVEVDFNEDGEIDATDVYDAETDEYLGTELNQVDLDMQANESYNDDPDMVLIDVDDDGRADMVGADLDGDGQIDYATNENVTIEDQDGDGLFETVEIHVPEDDVLDGDTNEVDTTDDIDDSNEYYDEDFGDDYDNDADVSDMV